MSLNLEKWIFKLLKLIWYTIYTKLYPINQQETHCNEQRALLESLTVISAKKCYSVSVLCNMQLCILRGTLVQLMLEESTRMSGFYWPIKGKLF